MESILNLPPPHVVPVSQCLLHGTEQRQIHHTHTEYMVVVLWFWQVLHVLGANIAVLWRKLRI